MKFALKLNGGEQNLGKIAVVMAKALSVAYNAAGVGRRMRAEYVQAMRSSPGILEGKSLISMPKPNVVQEISHHRGSGYDCCTVAWTGPGNRRKVVTFSFKDVSGDWMTVSTRRQRMTGGEWHNAWMGPMSNFHVSPEGKVIPEPKLLE